MLIKPIISEKSLAEAAGKRYTFEVEKTATKPDVARAVEKTFGVKVMKVRTAIMPGKKYRLGKKFKFETRPEWKKAIITIKPDQQIDLFETSAGKSK